MMARRRRLNIDFEPFKPINTSLYLCDNKFHTEALNELLESDSKCVLYQCSLHAKPHSPSCRCTDMCCRHAWSVPIDKDIVLSCNWWRAAASGRAALIGTGNAEARCH